MKKKIAHFNTSDENILNIDDQHFDRKGVFFFEVTIDYPESLHDAHRDLPFLPINRIPPYGKTPKLITSLDRKEKYICHYKTLALAIRNWLTLIEVHRGISFKQTAWVKSFVDYNTEFRRQSTNSFDSLFFKLFFLTLFMGRPLRIFANEKKSISCLVVRKR